MASLAINQLQLAPLGAGDLIDRTVRLYRRHFAALVRASVPPVIVSAVGSVLWAVSTRAFGLTDDGGRLAAYISLALVGLALQFVGLISQLIVMGGATRNLVTHLLWGEQVTARLIYRSVRARFWGLLAATLAIVFWVNVAGGLALAGWFAVVMLLFVGVALAGSAVVAAPWLVSALSLAVVFAASVGALYLFFFVAGRVAYVPQVMMVEARGVLAAIGRSTELARGNARRLMAMFLFTGFATCSAVMLLLLPLGWYAYLNGVDLLELDAARQPVWYSIGYQVVWQVGGILLTPVWMLGLSLLYVDERVRHEGYDVELLAAQRLGEMPALPAGVTAPLAPALAGDTTRGAANLGARADTPGSVLGLWDGG